MTPSQTTPTSQPGDRLVAAIEAQIHRIGARLVRQRARSASYTSSVFRYASGEDRGGNVQFADVIKVRTGRVTDRRPYLHLS